MLTEIWRMTARGEVEAVYFDITRVVFAKTQHKTLSLLFDNKEWVEIDFHAKEELNHIQDKLRKYCKSQQEPLPRQGSIVSFGGAEQVLV